LQTVIETTVELAQKAGVSEIVGKIVNELKDEAEPYRKMVMETITKVVATLGASDVDERLEMMPSFTPSRSKPPRIKSCWMASVPLSMHLVSLISTILITCC
jgi:hypothetical protein